MDGNCLKQDPETLEWEAWTMQSCYEMISNIEYFPEMGAVVAFGATRTGRSDTELCAYDVESGEWFDLPTPGVQGRHSLMRYNPVRGEVLLLGGDQSYRTAEILRADGTLRRVADSPRNTRIRVDTLSVDPISGPFSSEHVSPVTVALPEYGVTMWIETTRSGVHLYKHDAPES